MEVQVIHKTSRSVVIELIDQGIYYTEESYKIYINGEFIRESNQVIQTISGLKPSTAYGITVSGLNDRKELEVTTESEFVTLDVRSFGARGDGVQDDTLFIQAAVLSCPKDGRVLIPGGIYKVSSIFLKDDLRLEIAEDAVLSAYTDRKKFAVLPGMVESYDEASEYNLGSWEGNPLDIFAGIITGINVSNVVIYGGGRIEGNGDFSNWWEEPRKKEGAYRPRMVYLNHCKNVTIENLHFSSSPSWTIHPYFSENLRFIDLKIHNPENSPNTDGIDPESCRQVEIVGVYFSLGDDCIAVKSGKIYMGAKYKRPCEDILIRQCCMNNGHGAVTIGSEMSGGVYGLTARDCLFLHTDRGLRIKTRRGRGKDAVLNEITFENIRMEHVKTPFAINSFYFCDPDGHTEYVRSKEKLPVDERTPFIKKLCFKNIKAEHCHVAGFFIYGLPERKIEEVELKDITVSFAEEPEKGYPEMLEGIGEVSGMGLFANNIKRLVLNNVEIKGHEGEALLIENVDELEIK